MSGGLAELLLVWPVSGLVSGGLAELLLVCPVSGLVSGGLAELLLVWPVSGQVSGKVSYLVSARCLAYLSCSSAVFTGQPESGYSWPC